MFAYENWPVFRDLVELRMIALQLSRKYRGRGLGKELGQLEGSTSSAVLNLGEGAKKPKKGHKLEHYGSVLGSLGESNAALIILSTALPREQLLVRARLLCNRAAPAVTNLMKKVERDWP